MSQATFRAGVGRVTITPPLTIPHAGWGAQTHILPDGIETDLWATVLLVDDGHETAAIVDLDLVILTGEESEAVRRAVARVLKIDPRGVRVSLTHNHAGPPPSDWDWVDEGLAAHKAYYASLPDVIAGAARLALNTMKPARVGVGAGESRVAKNRRETAPGGRTVTGTNFSGPIDPQVLVIRIDAQDGSPLAVVCGYTMHPTTLGPTNRLLSSDWPGHLKRTVETMTGATCIFAQGATGNVGPGPEGFTDDVRVVRTLGLQIGCEAVRVHASMHLPPVQFRHERIWESGAPLGRWAAAPVTERAPVVRSRSHALRLPLLPQPSLADVEAKRIEAQTKLQGLIARGAPAADIEAVTWVTKRANMAVRRVQLFGGRSELAVELHALQIGPAVLAAIPCEPFCDIALAIKAGSPFPFTWFGGYVGGWFGYLPVPEEYARRGYEVDTTPYAPEAARVVIDGTVALLKEMHRDWSAETMTT